MLLAEGIPHEGCSSHLTERPIGDQALGSGLISLGGRGIIGSGVLNGGRGMEPADAAISLWIVLYAVVAVAGRGWARTVAETLLWLLYAAAIGVALYLNDAELGIGATGMAFITWLTVQAHAADEED